MIVGIGTDLIEIERVRKACQKQAFYTRCFSVREQELIKENMSKAAGNWAVKESIGKCFGTGISGFQLNEIEVLRDKKGKPYVELYGSAQNLCAQLEIDTIHVSITNTEDYAIAYVIAERNRDYASS
ncbi:MAG: holo-ACP synthase [Eubacteriales bacterium]